MPVTVLTPAQLATMLDWLQVQPGLGSPLHAAATSTPLEAGDPALAVLVGAAVVVDDAGARRMNCLAAAAVAAAACPDEVLWVSTGEPDAAFTVCRRGPLYTECTVLADGRVKLSFPLSRSQVQLAMTSALSGDRPEPPPLGFAFRGSPADAFVLRVLLDGARRGGLAPAAVPGAVAAALDDPVRLLAFAGLAGTSDLHAMIDQEGALAAVLARLETAGHVRLEGGRVLPSPAALAVLGAPVLATLTVGRRLVQDSTVRQSELVAYRCGDRLLLLRAVAERGAPIVELTEVTRQQLRCHIGAFLLDDRPLATAPAAPPWRPTHRVPAEGVRTWAAPDPSAPERARLAGHLPVAVAERRGAWARVVASNGWTAWVDGRRLTELPRP